MVQPLGKMVLEIEGWMPDIICKIVNIGSGNIERLIEWKWNSNQIRGILTVIDIDNGQRMLGHWILLRRTLTLQIGFTQLMILCTVLVVIPKNLIKDYGSKWTIHLNLQKVEKNRYEKRYIMDLEWEEASSGLSSASNIWG